MKRYILPVKFLMVFAVPSLVFAAPDAAQDKADVAAVAAAFAASHLLGSGADQYVTSVSVLSGATAQAVIGEKDEERDDPQAYQADLQKRKGKWLVVAYQFVYKPTGKKTLEKLTPPYPAPHWDKVVGEGR
ncbi:MAG: hypothetical protein EPN21_14700 [Methylococcaceae bacterium]|nr:MAG: hypothetical protein EPN21_14700 [Methylococcaceae bacterium]